MIPDKTLLHAAAACPGLAGDLQEGVGGGRLAGRGGCRHTPMAR